MDEFEFRFETIYRPLLLAFGATPSTSRVVLDDTGVSARFGFVQLATPYSNIAGVEVSGDYKPWRAIGVRMSLTDRGLTFGSNTVAGSCLRFVEPVKPKPSLFGAGHTGLTVTVAEPERLRSAIEARLRAS